MWLFLCCLSVVFAQVRGEWRPVGPLGMVASPVQLTVETASTWVVHGVDGSAWRTQDAGARWERIADAVVIGSSDERWLLEVEARLEDLGSRDGASLTLWEPGEDASLASELEDAAALAVEASALVRSELEGDRWFLTGARPSAAVPAGCGPVTLAGPTRLVLCRSGLYQWFDGAGAGGATGEGGMGLQEVMDAAVGRSEAWQALRGAGSGRGRRGLPQLTAAIEARTGTNPGWQLGRPLRRAGDGDWVATLAVTWRPWPGGRTVASPRPYLLAGAVVLDDGTDRRLLADRLRRAMLADRAHIVERVGRLYRERQRLVALMRRGGGSIEAVVAQALRLAEVDAYLEALTGAVMGRRGMPPSAPREEP